MKETGFIFAAGIGSRLRPLTDNRPKALVKFNGKTLIDSVIEKFLDAGINRIIINVHHFPDQIIDHVKEKGYEADIVVSDERAYLRETAGGLKFAMPFWADSDLVVIHNVDIISDIDLRQLIDYHCSNHGDATLAVRNRTTSRYLLFCRDDRRLCGWMNDKTGERIIKRDVPSADRLAFSGIHVINTEFAAKVPSVEKLSLTNFYLDNAKERNIQSFLHDSGEWADVGKIEFFKDRLS